MNNRESQASAAFASGTRFVDAIKALKDLFRVHGRNSWAAVPDLDDRIPIGNMYIHSNLSACRRILHGVIDEIDQSLAQDQAVSLDRDGRITIHDDRLVLFFGKDIEQCSGFLHNIKQTEGRLLQVNMLRFVRSITATWLSWLRATNARFPSGCTSTPAEPTPADE